MKQILLHLLCREACKNGILDLLIYLFGVVTHFITVTSNERDYIRKDSIKVARLEDFFAEAFCDVENGVTSCN